MTRRLLRLPVPWGHQPHSPPDDPFAELIAARLGEGKEERTDCLADFAWPARCPTRRCLLGQRGECAWGVRDADARYCMWVWIRQHPDGSETQPLMAKALGQSKERINSVCKTIEEKYRVALACLSLPQPI